MGMVQYASMDRRFFHRLGASLLERTLCSSAGKVGMKITLGAVVGMDPERIDEAKLILIWGTNPIVSNLHLWSRVQEAKRRGAKLIAIDPYRSLTAAKCDQHLAPLPGTDAALALGMMHVIIAEGLHDADYVERHTLGFEQLRERVQEYPPQKAAAICGLAARGHRRARARVRAHAAGGDPAQLRHAAAFGRRHGGAHHHLPAGAHRRTGAMPPGAWCSRPADWYALNHARARTAGPDPEPPAHASTSRRSATR